MLGDIVVRVRGVYATALTEILVENNVKVADVSEKIRSRFNIEFSNEPPTVTLKDSIDGLGITAIGKPKHVDYIVRLLCDILEDCIE